VATPRSVLEKFAAVQMIDVHRLMIRAIEYPP
jgi:hypothetical protein